MKKKPTRITGRLSTTAFIDVVAADLDIPTDEAHRTVTAVFDAIARAAASGHDVAITNFGTWFAYRTKPRKARNPQTGEPVSVPAHPAVRFRVAPALAAAVRRRDRRFSIRKAAKGTAGGTK
ncbi:HU family DNA-binding protein [Streptomyces sp. 7R007]